MGYWLTDESFLKISKWLMEALLGRDSQPIREIHLYHAADEWAKAYLIMFDRSPLPILDGGRRFGRRPGRGPLPQAPPPGVRSRPRTRAPGAGPGPPQMQFYLAFPCTQRREPQVVGRMGLRRIWERRGN